MNDLIEKVYQFDPDILTRQKKKKKLEPSTVLPPPPSLLPPKKKPAAAPPSPAPAVQSPSEDQDEGQDDYLEFTPNDGSNKEEQPELYEDMQTAPDEGEGLYEESDPSAGGGGGGKGAEAVQGHHAPVPSDEGNTPERAHKGAKDEHESPYADTKTTKQLSSRDSLLFGWEYDVTVTLTERNIKVSELQNVKCKGMLEKKGGAKGETWQKRYCVLSDTFMYFYEKEDSKSFKNRVVVPMYATSLAPEHTNPKKKHFSFKLSSQNVSGKKDYHFRAKTEDDQTKWVNALKEVEMAHTTVQPSSSTMRIASTQSEVPKAIIKRSSSAGDLKEEEEEEYQDMIPEEKEEVQEEYEEVVPSQAAEELTESMEEYVAVQPANPGEAEDYEDPGSRKESPKPVPKLPLTTSRAAPPLPGKPQAPAPSPNAIVVDTSKIYAQPPEGVRYEKVYALLWDFVTSEKDEVTLKRGDLVYVHDPKPSAEWWLGELLDPDVTFKVGKKGYFPTSYCAAAFETVA